MKYFIYRAITDWAYKVNDGCPDPQNRTHIQILENVLRQYGCTEDFLSEYMPRVVDPNIQSPKLFQEFCVEVGKIISNEDLLIESSVWEKPVGTQQLAGSQTFNVWKGAPQGPYTVVKKTDNAIEVDLSPGESNPKIAYISAGGKTYKISGAQTKMSKLFKNAAKNTSPYKIKWEENTLESAACTGLYFDPTSHYKNIMTPNAEQSDVEGAIGAFKKALSKSNEYAGKSALDSIQGIPDVIRALELANGVHVFATAHNCKGWNFIHKSIQGYYTAGYNNDNIDSKGFKDNTADTIIVKGDPKALITAIGKEKVEFNSSGKCTTESGIEFYQVSNKLKKGGAQLGRIQQAFADMYGLKEPMDTWRVYLQKEIAEHSDEGFLLNEGLAQYFKQGLKYIKDKFTAILNTIKDKVSSFSSTMLSKLQIKMKKPSPSLDSFMKQEFNKAPANLKEGKSKPKYSYNAYAEMCTQAALNNDKSYYKRLLVKANEQWNILKKLLDVPDDGIDVTSVSSGPIDYTPKGSADGINYVVKLMVNYMAYEHLTAMLKNSKGQVRAVSKVLEDFVEMEKEMYFGKTDLPMFKVYGADMSGTAWEYLKSGKEFREDKLKAMNMTDAVKDGKYIPGVVVESTVQSGGFAAVKMWVLHSISEKGTKYTHVDLRSGRNDTLSFSVSGASITDGSKVLGKI